MVFKKYEENRLILVNVISPSFSWNYLVPNSFSNREQKVWNIGIFGFGFSIVSTRYKKYGKIGYF